jgi:hypothetical protein
MDPLPNVGSRSVIRPTGLHPREVGYGSQIDQSEVARRPQVLDAVPHSSNGIEAAHHATQTVASRRWRPGLEGARRFLRPRGGAQTSRRASHRRDDPIDADDDGARGKDALVRRLAAGDDRRRFVDHDRLLAALLGDDDLGAVDRIDPRLDCAVGHAAARRAIGGEALDHAAQRRRRRALGDGGGREVVWRAQTEKTYLGLKTIADGLRFGNLSVVFDPN